MAFAAATALIAGFVFAHPATIADGGSAPTPYWGDADWTLATLATPEGQRLADISLAAPPVVTPAPMGRPSLIAPGHFSLSAPAAISIREAYAALATPAPPQGARQGLQTGRLGQLTRSFSRPPAASEAILEAIAVGAEATGTSRSFLTRLASSESGMTPYARAPTSSAAGLFQFVDQTWLTAIKKYGPAFGLKREAEAIYLGRNGRAFVDNAAIRAQILSLRYNPSLASAFAGEVTQENARVLSSLLGRPPSAGELYAAHIFGPQYAQALITTARLAPSFPAYRLLPVPASTNRALFFTDGEPRSTAMLMRLLEARAGGAA